ncbi:MAG: hypothetical protein PHP86_08760 [Nevskiales bacterium]|nr:hypothetical protein [Nevskiales bacterium]
MAAFLTLLVIASVLLLAAVAVRRRRPHLRMSDWPLARQVETGVAALFAMFALLALLAGEHAFGGWLALMAAIIAAATLRGYR